MRPQTLDDIVSPITAEEFLGRIWGRTYARFPGTPGKFSELLPWAALNTILSQHRLDVPRLRLRKEGMPIAPERYTIREVSRRGVTVPRLQARALTDQLRDGATVVLDNVEELYTPVTDLAISLERTLGEPVRVNAYAGWRTSHGFDLHWDDHDVLVLQVCGRKRWSVYGPTRPWPLKDDIDPNLCAPTEALEEFVLTDGDALYIPRGWWHVAAPLDEPSLHLTCGCDNKTGITFMHWLADDLRSSELFRMDVPMLASRLERDAHARKLREEVLRRLDGDVLERYSDERAAAADMRPVFSLPLSASPEPVLRDTCVVSWLPARQLKMLPHGDQVRLEVAGRVFTWPTEIARVVEAISVEPGTFAELATRTGLERSALRKWLVRLLDDGLISVSDN